MTEHTAGKNALILGNDVVDLHKPGIHGKWPDSRFVQRVFTIKEQAAIRQASEPDVVLWAFWAAKETAFKMVSKLSQPPVFSHREFVVTPDVRSLSIDSGLLSVHVLTDTGSFPVMITITPDYVHAVGAIGRNENPHMMTHPAIERMGKFDYFSTVRERGAEAGNNPEFGEHLSRDLTDAERQSILNSVSADIRVQCKQEIAQRLSITPDRLQIIRPLTSGQSQPPYLLLDGARWQLDLSLSHHGRWLAWAVALPPSGHDMAHAESQ